MFHLAAWYSSVAPNGADATLAAVNDPVITTQGNDIRVPATLNNLIGAAILANGAATVTKAQIQSPSLRSVLNFDVRPVSLAKQLVANEHYMFHDLSPVPLVQNESLNVVVNDNLAAAGIHYALGWLSDGPLQAVNGAIYTVRCTSSVALSVGTWVNGNITFGQVLPAGSYQVVGMRAEGANLTAARLVFVGGTFRPGVPGIAAVATADFPYTRYGEGGVWGQFDNTTPPTIDCLGDTDTAQVLWLDLMKVK